MPGIVDVNGTPVQSVDEELLLAKATIGDAMMVARKAKQNELLFRSALAEALRRLGGKLSLNLEDQATAGNMQVVISRDGTCNIELLPVGGDGDHLAGGA